MREKLSTSYFLDLGGGCESTVLLAGCARSGSTWVSDLINYDNAYRYVFEPFRNDRAAVCRIFEGRQYLRPDVAEPRFYHAAEQILTGRLRQRWSDKHNGKLIARRRLVKAIRANLMLKWLWINFPEMQVVLLLRHPLAVASSKLKLGWPADLDTFLRQEDLMARHLDPFRDLLSGDLSPFEQHVLFWCVEHYVPLRELDPGDAAIFFYERFCTEPQREIARLFDFLGRGSVADAMRVLARPSSTTTTQAAISTGESLTHAWEKHISPDQRHGARRMLERFGLHPLYLENGLPTDDPEQVLRVLRGA